MKKLIFLFLAFLITLNFCSCSFNEDKNSDGKDENLEYLERIIVLQAEINKLSEKHDEYVSASNVKLEALSQELEALRKEESVTDAPVSVPERKEFQYELAGEAAIFTGYAGSETILVIPSHIDGNPVIKIGEKALSSSKLTTVIISEGVKEIDWFAFFNSPFLVNVTIPKSVTKIGYSAFDGCSSSLTIYCERDSYAHSYAESFGIPYVLV